MLPFRIIRHSLRHLLSHYLNQLSLSSCLLSSLSKIHSPDRIYYRQSGWKSCHRRFATAVVAPTIAKIGGVTRSLCLHSYRWSSSESWGKDQHHWYQRRIEWVGLGQASLRQHWRVQPTSSHEGCHGACPGRSHHWAKKSFGLQASLGARWDQSFLYPLGQNDISTHSFLISYGTYSQDGLAWTLLLTSYCLTASSSQPFLFVVCSSEVLFHWIE